MSITRKIGKVLTTDILKMKTRSEQTAGKLKIIAFMNKHGAEVTENLLSIPRSRVYAWMKTIPKKSKAGKKGKNHGRK